MAAAPAAGAVIDNQAEATFFDTDSGYHVRLRSNVVRVAVQAQEALTIAPAQVVDAPLGGFVTLPHRLTNTGNVASSYTLSLANVTTGDDYDLLGLQIVHDVNGNGQADVGEPTLANAQALGPFAPGQHIDLVVSGRLPTTVLLGQTALVNLSATTQLQTVSALVADRVTVGDGALLQVVKAVSLADARPGQVLRYSLTASNNGNRAATGVNLQVDGAPAVLTLLRDTIPANTRFSGIAPDSMATAASPVLYHLAGQPVFSYVSTAPADLSTVDGVAFAFRDAIPRGQTIRRGFDVQLNANASSRINNTAQFIFNDGIRAGAQTTDSNPVQTEVPALPPSISYFADPQYQIPLRVMPVGRRFFIEADAAQCNFDPLVVETKRLTVRSALTGDVETYQAEETGPNTGVFHVQPHVQSVDFGQTPAVLGDGLVSTRKDDRITTVLEGCGAISVEISLLIDPFGVVYDSRSNLPVAGAVVTLIDVTGAGNGGNPGGPARVFFADVTPAPSTVTTGPDGAFAFPLVPPSEYRLAVTAPAGYLFASVQPAALQPAGRVINTPGSYGGNFLVDANTGAVELDIPLDATARSDLFIDKTASRSTVELGDYLDYTVRVRNVADELIGRVRVIDRLPAGFAYVRGSARLNGGTVRLNGSTLPEPDGGVGPVLSFEIGSMNNESTATLTYRVRVGVGALQGDGINRVQARTPAPLEKISNEASAAVQVLPGVFSDRAFVVGKVFADCKRDEPYAAHDGLGVPGVRIYLQDGTHVVTDRQGRYSLYGLAARTHVLKLDATTLGGLTPKLTDHRQALDAASRFVDLKNGELHRADFALEGCTDELGQAIAERAAAADVERGEVDQMLAARFSTEPTTRVDPRSLPAAGTLSASGLQTGANRGATPKSANAADAQAAAVKPDSLSDEQIAALDNHLEIVNLKAGQTLAQPQASVIVKGRLGTRFKLTVNGVELGERRVGKRSTLEDKKLQVWEFIGVDFLPGKNELELEQHDAQGRIGERHMIVVTAPGQLAALRFTPSKKQPAADGKTPLPVLLEPLDANGLVIAARTPVTLDSAMASNGAASGVTANWHVRDLNPEEPGVQIFIEGGRAMLELLPPAEPGQAVLRATSGTVVGEATVSFVPDLRPLIAVGVIEGTLDLRRLSTSAFEPARAQDGFEQALRNLSSDFDKGRASAGAHAALFLKGRIKGDMLLTAGYDSEKTRQERLFRDIQPDAYYAVYGDSSTRGFDAQSTGRLYVRVDHSRFYALLGDFNTQHVNTNNGGQNGALASVGERKLGQVARSLNGAKGQMRSADGRSEGGAFASRAVSRQVVQEIPAQGISGPYLLERKPFVENSERVEIITRDRDVASRIVRTVTMTRFADYEVEPLTGRLLFRAPVPSLDPDFNPNTIRVSYEVDQGGDAFWVAGVQGSHQVSDRLTVSGALMSDSNPQDRSKLASAMAVAKINDQTAVAVEVARMDKDSAVAGPGSAARVEFKHDGALVQAQAHVSHVERGFDNPAAGVAAGQQEMAARVAVRIDPETVVKGELIASVDLATDASRKGVQVGIERHLNQHLRGEVSLRQSDVTAAAPATTTTTNGTSTTTSTSTTPGAPDTSGTSVRVKLLGQLPSFNNASVFVEAEQDVQDSERRMVALGGEAQLGSGVRLYGRHELISTLGQRYGLNDQQQRNATVLGISGAPFADGQAFSEYRLRNALSSREAEAAMGLRQRWALGPGLALSAGIERVNVLAGEGSNESTAITGGVDYNDGGDWRANGRLELRHSPRSDGLLSTLGAAWRIDAPWTLLARNALSITRNSDGSGNTEDWLQVGAAYRDVDHNRLNALLRAEYRGQRSDAADGTSTARDAFIVSAHASQQWEPGTVLSGRYAAKWVRDQGLGFDNRSRTQLLSARLTQDLGERWDVSVHSAVLVGGGARQLGLGLEAGYLLSQNLWVSGGYNFFGYRDRELAGQDYTNPGVYLRLRFKFDENSF